MSDTSTDNTERGTDIIQDLFNETLHDRDFGDQVNAAAGQAQPDTVPGSSVPPRWNGETTTDHGETPLLPGDKTIDRGRNNMVKSEEVSEITLGETEARALKQDDDRHIESNALHQNLVEFAKAELGPFVEESFEDYPTDLREKSVEQRPGAVQSFGYSIRSPHSHPIPRRGEGIIGSVDQNFELHPQREKTAREHALERMREPKVITGFPGAEGSPGVDDLDNGQGIDDLNPATRDELFPSSTERPNPQDQEPSFSEPRTIPGAGLTASDWGQSEDILNQQLDEQTKIARALDEISRQGLHFVTGVGMEGL